VVHVGVHGCKSLVLCYVRPAIAAISLYGICLSRTMTSINVLVIMLVLHFAGGINSVAEMTGRRGRMVRDSYGKVRYEVRSAVTEM
jgi:hypothetical protein